jgi:hypothetical protein
MYDMCVIYLSYVLIVNAADSTGTSAVRNIFGGFFPASLSPPSLALP